MKKDNFTDVVQALPKEKPTDTPPKDQRVVTSTGEIVLLGQNTTIKIKGKSLELTLGDIQKIIKQTVNEEMKGLPEKILQKVEAELKRKKVL